MKQMLIHFFILVFGFSFQAMGSDGFDFSAIINGDEVQSSDKNCMSVVGVFQKVQLSDERVWLNTCTGSVLSKRLILTAAHCLEKVKNTDELLINFSLSTIDNRNQFDPLVRERSPEKKFTTIKVKNFRLHEKFSSGSYGENDLAIILLQQDVPAPFEPVKFLPEKRVNFSANRTDFEGLTYEIMMYGYGIFSEFPQVVSLVMRSAKVKAKFSNDILITDQTGGRGGCRGDSGGPAFVQIEGVSYQVGVISGPYGASLGCDEEGLLLNPVFYTEFLQRAARELSSDAL